MKNNRKKCKAAIFAVLLLLLPAFFLGAQQSFFIAPGQTIRNGDIADGYCLEYTQKTISNNNLEGLLYNIDGMVRVIYANKSTEYVGAQGCQSPFSGRNRSRGVSVTVFRW